MRELSTIEREAIETVANRYRAVWSRATNRAGGFLTIAGRPLAVDVIAGKPRGSRRASAAEPRLRFDKVALRVVSRLRATCSQAVRGGTTVIVTITAPIRLAAKTATALEDEIRALLTARTRRTRLTRTIHANQIQVVVVKGGTSRTSKLLGFVHNADSDPEILFDVARTLLACIGSDARARAKKAGGRWLVLANQDDLSPIGTYRHVGSQLGAREVFDRIDAVMPGGRIEPVSG